MTQNSSPCFNVMRRLLLATILVTTVHCNRKVNPSQEHVFAARLVADDFIAAMRRSDYEAAAKLFSYPSGNSATNRAEADVMSRRLETLQRQFGVITSFAGSTLVMPYIDVAISPGTVRYWAHHRSGLRLIFDVRFGSYGGGFLIMDLWQPEGAGWQLQSVHYGLPAFDPCSSARVAATASQL
jgi:hypothetical protein